MTVSIITVNLNHRRLLNGWFRSLKQQTFRDYEVIVVDNGSTDDSVSWLKKKHPEVKLIRNSQNLGFSPACNQGARIAKGKYLFFVNNDGQLEKQCLEKLVSVIKDHEVAMVGPIVYQADKKYLESAGFFPTLTGFFYYPKKLLALRPYPVFGLSGAALMIKKAIFQKIGGFDENFFAYSEDADLAARIQLNNYGLIKIVSQAHYYHQRGQTSKILPRALIIYHTTKNRLYLLRKNFQGWLFGIMIINHLICLVGGITLFMLLGKKLEAQAVIKGIIWAMKKKILKIKPSRFSNWQIMRKYFKIYPLNKLCRIAWQYLKAW